MHGTISSIEKYQTIGAPQVGLTSLKNTPTESLNYLKRNLLSERKKILRSRVQKKKLNVMSAASFKGLS